MRDLVHSEILEISGGLTDSQFAYAITMATQSIFQIGLRYTTDNLCFELLTFVPPYVLTPAVSMIGYVVGCEISNQLTMPKANVSSTNAK